MGLSFSLHSHLQVWHACDDIYGIYTRLTTHTCSSFQYHCSPATHTCLPSTIKLKISTLAPLIIFAGSLSPPYCHQLHTSLPPPVSWLHHSVPLSRLPAPTCLRSSLPLFGSSVPRLPVPPPRLLLPRSARAPQCSLAILPLPFHPSPSYLCPLNPCYPTPVLKSLAILP
ncbi:uncharacterized protein LOC144536621 [Sander vitreus]